MFQFSSFRRILDRHSFKVTADPILVEIATDMSGADALLVTVSDSGTGLDPLHRHRMFDGFYTTKPHGMGRGLAISRSIIEAHGGRLWATPNDGTGETFHFTLPV